MRRVDWAYGFAGRFGAEADPQAVAEAALGPLLPARIELSGVVLLGRGPYALARLLAPAPDLQDAVRGLRERVAHPHSPTWTAHVTLARRVRPDQLTAACGAIATGPAVARELRAVGLRRWDPDAGATRLLVGHPAAAPRPEGDSCGDG